MMKFLREFKLSPGQELPALIGIMVKLQKYRAETVQASIGKVSRTTALLSAGLLNSNIISAMEEAGLNWSDFSEQSGARGFDLREVASEEIPDPDLHGDLRSALKTYRTLLPNRPVDAAGLIFAILRSIDPAGSGLPARLRQAIRSDSLEEFVPKAIESLARMFPDLPQLEPPPKPAAESKARLKSEKRPAPKKKSSTMATQKAPKKKKTAKKPETPPGPAPDPKPEPDPPTPPDDSYQPEPRVARDYWTTEDHLGLGDYADAVASFLIHKETRPPLTIGVKAPWGAGKTSLMRMIQLRLDPPDDPAASRWVFNKIKLTQDARQVLEATEESLEAKHVDSDGAQSEKSTEDKNVEPDGAQSKISAEDKNVDSDGAQSVRSVLRRLDRAPEAHLDFSGIIATKMLIEDDNAKRVVVDDDDWRATVWFNPWMYQSGEEVWAGFVHEIVQQVTGRLERRDRERFWFELNLRRLDRQAVRRKIYQVAFERVLPTALVFGLGLVLVLALILLLGLVPTLKDLPQLSKLTSFALSANGLQSAGVLWAARVAWKFGRFYWGDASTAVDSLFKSPSFGGAANTLRKEFEGTLDDILPEFDYASKTGFLHLVQNDIRHVLDLVATKERPLVIFVDDLDRCSPGVVAQTIEAINLFLAGEFPNCIFVLAVEPAVVAAHVEVAHEKLVERLKTSAVGSDWSTLGWRFLEKIVQLPLSLPRADADQTTKYLESLFASGQETQDVLTKKKARERIEAKIEESTKKATKSMKAANVTLESLPELLKNEQDSFVGADVAPEEAKEVREKVAAALFERFFKDSDSVVQSIVTKEALQLPSRNAREIKRLLNLFRFYAFIAARRRLLDLESESTQRATLEVVARLSVFLIRWPFLLNLVSQPADEGSSQPQDKDDRGPIQFEVLEKAASGDDATWEKALVSIGLATEHTQKSGPAEPDLRKYLCGHPAVGKIARGLL